MSNLRALYDALNQAEKRVFAQNLLKSQQIKVKTALDRDFKKDIAELPLSRLLAYKELLGIPNDWLVSACPQLSLLMPNTKKTKPKK